MTARALDAPSPGGRALGQVIELVSRLPGLGMVTGVHRLRGMTNATYRVELGRQRVVVRMAAAGDDPVVDRAVELHNHRVAHTYGLAPGVLFADLRRHVLVTEFVEGRELGTADVADPHTIERIGRLLRTLHDLPPRRYHGRFTPFVVADRYADRLAAGGDPLDAGELAVLDGARRLRAALTAAGSTATCHNDPWPGNILVGDQRLLLIDWEYSGLGDPLWDLAHFAVESRLDDDQAGRLLTAWHGRVPPPSMCARLALWRPVTDVVWALWARVQHAGGNDREDLRAYARGRLHRARRTLEGDALGRALAVAAGAAGHGTAARVGLAG